jgi:pre-mRNA-splicing factor ATP-dependent RNA helicase DHX38/PRP16
VQWASNEDRELWEEEQKRLDREWYAIDEGYDDDNNPFANLSEDYTKKKEEQLEQRRKKRMSAQQRQINKVIRNFIPEILIVIVCGKQD